MQRMAQGAVLLLVLGFWAKALADNWQTFTTYSWRISWPLIGVAFVVLLVQMVMAGAVWWRALAVSGARIPFRAGMSLFLQAQLGRYLPGAVWEVVGRFALGEQVGVSRRAMAASIGLELGLQVVTGGVYLLAALALRADVAGTVYGPLTGLVMAAVLLLLSPPIFTRFVNWGLALLKRPPLEMALTYGELLLLFVARFIAHGVLGLGFYLFTLGLAEIPLGLAPLLICGYVGAWLVGYLAVLAPMGLGVREGAFVLLAGNQVLFAVATAAAVGYRVLTALRDLLSAGVGVWLQRTAPARVLSLLSLLFLVSACAAPTGPELASADVVEVLSRDVDARFARAYEPVTFQFPRDHGPHEEYATEWWYYTGNLTDEAGGAYGYQLTFFRTALLPGEPQRASDLAATQVYMAHFAVTSGPDQVHESFDRFSRGAGGLAGAQGEPAFAVWLEDWRAEQIGPGQYRLAAAAEKDGATVALELTLAETRPPLLHGDRGLSQKGPEPGNASYYYSLVEMETEGSVTVGDRTASVKGLSWMDHEFGTSALSGDAVGWDWFAVTLDNGVVLMFAQIRSRSGQPQDIFEGTLAYPDGRQVPIAPEDFVLTATGSWTSPVTGITYPSGWRVVFPAQQIDLTIEPLIPDQEMRVAFTYYEGATRIRGTMEGQPVQGRGYVELTGYGAQGFGR